MAPPNNPTSLSAVIPLEVEAERAAQPTATLVKQLVMPAILVLFATYLLFGIVTMRVPAGVTFPGPRFFPLIIMGGLYLFGALLAVAAFRDLGRARAALATGTAADTLAVDAPVGAHAAGGEAAALRDESMHDEAPQASTMEWRSLAWIVGAFVVFSLTLQWLGWIIAAALLFWAITRAFGAGRPWFNVLVGLTASSVAYILFDMVLGLPLPSGILGGGF